jgi:hypothetical protein
LIDILIKRTDINMNSTANEKLEITRLWALCYASEYHSPKEWGCELCVHV